MFITNRSARVLGVLVSCLFFVGCQENVAMAPQATDDLASLRNQLFTAKAQIQRSSNAARDLLEQPRQDLTAQINMLQSEVANLNMTTEQSRAQAAEFRQETAVYFAKWDETLKGMSEQTAAGGKKRMAMAKSTIERLRAQANDVRADIAPFVAKLNEAAKYLATDTTRAGLDVVEPQLKSALKYEKPILDGIDKLVETIDEIRAGK